MIYEQRVYTVELNKREPLIAEIKKCLSLWEKHGVKGLGPFRTVIGNSNEISYFMIYESMAHREQAWEAGISDADLIKFRKEMAERSEKMGGQGLLNVANTLLSPAE